MLLNRENPKLLSYHAPTLSVCVLCMKIKEMFDDKNDVRHLFLGLT